MKRLLLTIAVVCFLGGCQHAPPVKPHPTPSVQPPKKNLDDQKDKLDGAKKGAKDSQDILRRADDKAVKIQEALRH